MGVFIIGLGLSVGCIVHDMDDEDRKDAIKLTSHMELITNSHLII
jgi:preprotein translocase subunit SecA